MGAQSSHHEPLNMGGLNINTTNNISNTLNSTGAPDFNRGGSVRAPHIKTSLASKALNPRNTIRRSLRKRKERRKNKLSQAEEAYKVSTYLCFTLADDWQFYSCYIVAAATKIAFHRWVCIGSVCSLFGVPCVITDTTYRQIY